MKNKHILFGIDDEENIVAIEPLRTKPYVEVFKREDGKVTSRLEPYEYLIYTTEKDLKSKGLKEQEGVKIDQLFGGNYYNRLIRTKNVQEFYKFKNILDHKITPYRSSLYMLQTGKTLFNGMGIDQPKTLFFDLEVMTTKGYNFPKADRDGDEIFIIAIRITSDGEEEEYVLHTGEEEDEPDNDVTYLRFTSEKALIERFVQLFRVADPDVVANHNIFNFDFNYLKERADRYGIELQLGRDGSTPNIFHTKIKFADRERGYDNYHLYGRHVIDTQFLSEYADVVLRNMPSYRLKDLVKYLGKASDNRTYIEGEDIASTWRKEHPLFGREDLLNYAIDDVREAEILYKEFAGSIFTLTHMIPMGYQEVFRYGTGNQVEYVFMREYLRNNYSFPLKDEPKHIKGGYADVLQFGLIKGSIIYADVKSLYPSLATILKIQPRKDELKIYPKILELLIETRYDIKAKIKEYQSEGRSDLVQKQKALDGSVKIFLNTMSYGYLAFSQSGFNDYDEAERITVNGQRIVKQMNNLIVNDGGVPIKVDTDGTACKLPKEWIGKEEEYCDYLTERLPDGIVIECDGMYDAILSFDRKSYALLEKDGTVKIKGNTLIGRSIEPLLTRFIDDSIHALFNDEIPDESLADIYRHYIDLIKNKEIEARDIKKRQSLKMDIEEYLNRKEAGNTNIIAQYELAIKSPKPYGKGDVIEFYVKEYPYRIYQYRGKPKLMRKRLNNAEAAELLENYNNDYEIDYYIERLEKVAKKFVVLGKDKFERYFNNQILLKKSDINKYEKLTGLTYEIRSNRDGRKST